MVQISFLQQKMQHEVRMVIVETLEVRKCLCCGLMERELYVSNNGNNDDHDSGQSTGV